jgi:hypothetical protein
MENGQQLHFRALADPRFWTGVMIDHPGEPLGSGPLTIWQRKLIKWMSRYMVISITGALRKPQASGGVVYEIQFPKIPPGFTFPWQKPNKELDPTVAVASGTFVYISPQNDLVTTGLVDLQLNALTYAYYGIWQAVQNVPAQVTVAGVVKYNVPQIPTVGAVAPDPMPNGPLAGDLDNPDLFWIPWYAITCDQTGAFFE